MPPKKKQSTRIQKRRKLDELFVSGVEVRFTKGKAEIGPFEDEAPDDCVVIWVQPCNPLQREQVVRNAQAAKSRALLNAKGNEESPDYVNTEAWVAGMTTDELIDQIVESSESENQRKAIRDVLALEEWEDIKSLQDSIQEWEAAGSPDPEEDDRWAGLLARDAEYGKQVNDRLDEIREDMKDGLGLIPRAELAVRAKEKRFELVGTQAFIEAYEIGMLFHSCRDNEDHDELFFESINDLKSAPEKVRATCSRALNNFIIEADEAKNSPRVDPGLDQSDLPEKEETSDSSTPEEPTE